jgi:hypothetical protein
MSYYIDGFLPGGSDATNLDSKLEHGTSNGGEVPVDATVR